MGKEGKGGEHDNGKRVQKNMAISAAGARPKISREHIQIEMTTKNREAKQN